jgi:5S rRNA maturation endonuclease (ribonuclease M5)
MFGIVIVIETKSDAPKLTTTYVKAEDQILGPNTRDFYFISQSKNLDSEVILKIDFS